MANGLRRRSSQSFGDESHLRCQKVVLLVFLDAAPPLFHRFREDVLGGGDRQAQNTRADINANELTTFDVEYMFTQIRSKSVGESSRINVTCNSCNHQTEVDVPLDEIKMDMPIVDPNIALTDQISLKMKWPSYVEVMEQDLVDKNETQQTFELLIECIEKVVTQDENIIFKDEPRQSRLEFVESLTASQFSKIRNYIEQMPKMKYDLKYKCGNCGQEHKLTLEGMQDFL